jgi:hypothetical protein
MSVIKHSGLVVALPKKSKKLDKRHLAALNKLIKGGVKKGASCKVVFFHPKKAAPVAVQFCGKKK